MFPLTVLGVQREYYGINIYTTNNYSIITLRYNDFDKLNIIEIEETKKLTKIIINKSIYN